LRRRSGSFRIWSYDRASGYRGIDHKSGFAVNCRGKQDSAIRKTHGKGIRPPPVFFIFADKIALPIPRSALRQQAVGENGFQDEVEFNLTEDAPNAVRRVCDKTGVTSRCDKSGAANPTSESGCLSDSPALDPSSPTETSDLRSRIQFYSASY